MSKIKNYTSSLSSDYTWTQLPDKPGFWYTPATGNLLESNLLNGLFIGSKLIPKFRFDKYNRYLQSGFYEIKDGNLIIGFNSDSLLGYNCIDNPGDYSLEIITNINRGLTSSVGLTLMTNGPYIVSVYSKAVIDISYILKLGNEYVIKNTGLSPLGIQTSRLLDLEAGSLNIIANGPVILSAVSYSSGGGGGGSSDDYLQLEDN